jgi:hypothetical protein
LLLSSHAARRTSSSTTAWPCSIWTRSPSSCRHPGRAPLRGESNSIQIFRYTPTALHRSSSTAPLILPASAFAAPVADANALLSNDGCAQEGRPRRARADAEKGTRPSLLQIADKAVYCAPPAHRVQLMRVSLSCCVPVAAVPVPAAVVALQPAGHPGSRYSKPKTVPPVCFTLRFACSPSFWLTIATGV